MLPLGLELLPFGRAHRLSHKPSMGARGLKARPYTLAPLGNPTKCILDYDRQLMPVPTDFKKIVLAFSKVACPQIPVHFTVKAQNSIYMYMFTSP